MQKERKYIQTTSAGFMDHEERREIHAGRKSWDSFAQEVKRVQ
jgi:hypothetical protein